MHASTAQSHEGLWVAQLFFCYYTGLCCPHASHCRDSAHLHQQLACAEVLCGAAEWNLVVHRQGQFPRAALCPVRLLWVPRDTPLASSASSEDQAWYPDCGLWIWAHAAAFQDVAAELQQALQLLDLQGGAQGGGQAAQYAGRRLHRWQPVAALFVVTTKALVLIRAEQKTRNAILMQVPWLCSP